MVVLAFFTLFIIILIAGLMTSEIEPNQLPERKAWTGPAISVEATPLHTAFSFEKAACAEPRVAHLGLRCLSRRKVRASGRFGLR